MVQYRPTVIPMAEDFVVAAIMDNSQRVLTTRHTKSPAMATGRTRTSSPGLTAVVLSFESRSVDVTRRTHTRGPGDEAEMQAG